MYPDILALLNSNDQKEIEKFLNNIKNALVVDKDGYIPIVEITKSPRGLEYLKFLICCAPGILVH